MSDDTSAAEKGRAKKRSIEAIKAAAAGGNEQLRAALAASDVSADAFVDARKKSRNQEIVERAVSAAEAPAPTDHTLDVMEGGRNVEKMARASIEPDWHDNPDHLDTPDEVRKRLRDDGLGPMDIGSKKEAMFGHFLIHAHSDDANRVGRSPEQLEAEHDMVVEKMQEFGIDHDSPLDLRDIEDETDDDPFGAAIDLSLGGRL